MGFDRLHRLATTLVVWVGIGTLHLSGEFPSFLTFGAAGLSVAGWFTHGWFERKVTVSAMGVLAALTGIWVVWQALASTDYLYWAIVFAILLGAAKSLMLRRGSDFMQMYVLSFLHIMSAAVVNPGLSFGVLMLPFVISLVLGLMLTNLRRGIEALALGEEPGGTVATDAVRRRLNASLARRDLVRPGFVSLTVGVTVFVFLISLLFFFLFPRLGLGFFAQQSRIGMSVTGFSQEVTLGNFGNMIEDPEVVIRVRGLDGRLAPPLRIRGQSLDEYDGLTWRKTTQQRKQLSHDPEGLMRTLGFRGRPGEQGIRKQEVYLEPMAGTPRVLFGLPMPVAFERPSNAMEALRPSRWRFYEDQSGDVTVTGPDAVSIVYTVYSDPRPQDPARLRAATGEIPQWILDAYLKLPPMDAGVAAMARQVAANASTPYDIAVAVQDHLRSGYTYALGTDHGDEDPLSDFILLRREGHCEYFASAMVVMLRVLGIPSRIVNGFYGGIRNDYGDYVSLRRADAHSWVEAYFPGEGWATFEPTPASAFDLRANRSWYQGIADALDAMKLGWYRWVIEYNLEKQVHFLASLLRLKRGGDGFSDGTALSVRDMRRMRDRLKEIPWGRILLSVPVLVLLVVGARFAWKRRGVLRGQSPARDRSVKAYRRLRKVLRRRGLQRDPGETQREFASRVGHSVPGVRKDVQDVTGAYLDFEFGGRQADPGLDDAVERVARGLSERDRRTPGDSK